MSLTESQAPSVAGQAASPASGQREPSVSAVRSWFALLASDISVLFRRRRTWTMLLALAAVPVLIAVAVRVTRGGESGRGPTFLAQIEGNGLFVVFTALLVSIPLFLPLTVGVVAGDAIAGEASSSTLRYLLVAPTGRARLLASKYLSSALFCVSSTVVVALSGVIIGAILFRVGPVTLLSGDTVSVGGAIGRICLICAYASVSLLGMCAIGLMFSTFTDVPVGAMAATITLAVASQVLDQLPQLAWLGPWLFSHYWLGFADMLRQPIDLTSFGQNALLQLGYIVVCGGIATWRFLSKDILS